MYIPVIIHLHLQRFVIIDKCVLSLARDARQEDRILHRERLFIVVKISAALVNLCNS